MFARTVVCGFKSNNIVLQSAVSDYRLKIRERRKGAEREEKVREREKRWGRGGREKGDRAGR